MTTELSTHIYLGNDTDCETCGSTYNDVEYEYEPVTGVHRVQVRVGCYGGDRIESTDADAVRAFLIQWVGPYDAADELGDLDAAIAALSAHRDTAA